MAILTKGTQIFFIDPDTSEVVKVTKCTAFNPGSAPADQIETTDLEELDMKQYMKGLRTPGQASATVQADPREASHVRLHELAEDGEGPIVHWVLGWGDGTDVPTVDSDGAFELPTTRSWFPFDAYVSDFPFDFQINTVVTTALTLQRTGSATWQKKAEV